MNKTKNAVHLINLTRTKKLMHDLYTVVNNKKCNVFRYKISLWTKTNNN